MFSAAGNAPPDAVKVIEYKARLAVAALVMAPLARSAAPGNLIDHAGRSVQ